MNFCFAQIRFPVFVIVLPLGAAIRCVAVNLVPDHTSTLLYFNINAWFQTSSFYSFVCLDDRGDSVCDGLTTAVSDAYVG